MVSRNAVKSQRLQPSGPARRQEVTVRKHTLDASLLSCRVAFEAATAFENSRLQRGDMSCSSLIIVGLRLSKYGSLCKDLPR